MWAPERPWPPSLRGQKRVQNHTSGIQKELVQNLYEGEGRHAELRSAWRSAFARIKKQRSCSNFLLNFLLIQRMWANSRLSRGGKGAAKGLAAQHLVLGPAVGAPALAHQPWHKPLCYGGGRRGRRLAED